MKFSPTKILLWPVSFVVLIYQSVVLALGQVWTNKLRSILTTLGIVIGVASVSTVVAALTGLQKRVLNEFESFGTRKMFVFPARPDWGGRRANVPFKRLEPELFDGMLAFAPGVESFTRNMRTQMPVSFGTKNEDVQVSGIEPPWHEIENRFVTVGRPFGLIDTQQARPVALITPKLQDRLGMDRDPTGQSMLIDGQRFTVIGIVEAARESTFLGDGSEDLEVYVPFNTIHRMRPFNGTFVIAQAVSTDAAPEAVAEVQFYMRQKRGISVGEPDDFRVEFIERFVQQFNSIALAITAVATGIVAISLLVGGIGIMNIMLVSVSERTREIGLRKAVGARPGAILLQFLIEAVVLCLIGGLVGLAIGQTLVAAVARIPAAGLADATIPPWAIALSFGFSAVVGLVFGMFPAIKAARLDPIDALRHE